MIAPAYLFIGSRTILEKETLSFLKQNFCRKESCENCITCTQIESKQHHGAIWIEPEKRYTLAEIEIISQKAILGLDRNQHCFFVLTKADFLTPACANSLLKLVEEPPPGYHFIFLAERRAQVLPTIRSRCTEKVFRQKGKDHQIPTLVQQFMRLDADPLAFSKELTKCTMTEQECMLYLDELLAYWIAAYKRTLQSNNQHHQATAYQMVTLLKRTVKTPPSPGSAKIFWKNLFLQRG